MVRAFLGFAFHKILNFCCLTSTIAPRNSKILSQSRIPYGSNLCSFSTRQLSDEMSQSTMLAFRALSLLKSTSVESDILASIHCLSLKTNALIDLAARTSLLAAYATVQDLSSALVLFDEATTSDVILWNAIISAFVHNSHFRSSILLFQAMIETYGEFDSTTLLIVLSALSRTHKLKCGTILHATIIKRNFAVDSNLCNALIDMYAKCGNMSSSELVFEDMEVKDTASWNCMISGCAYNGFPERSLYYFSQMRCFSVTADAVTISSAIAACSLSECLLGYGESVHALAIKTRHETCLTTSLSNCLVSFYSSYENVEAAEMVFNSVVNKNVVTWNSMISGFLHAGKSGEAMSHFCEMVSKVMIQPDDTTLVTVLSACAELNLLYQGKSIHGFALRRGIHILSSPVENALLDMYLECGDLRYAELLFKCMPAKDIISWNTMIFQLSHNNSLKKETQVLFHKLLQSGLRCNMVTFLAILPSCDCLEDLSFGEVLHSCLIQYGFSNNVSVVNALMLMYINCGDLNASTFLLESILSASDIISWNTMIVGCVQNGYYKEALKFFASMRALMLLKPDSINLGSALSAGGNLGLLSYGQSLHGLAVKSLLDCDVRINNALLTMYFRCNNSNSAEAIFKLNGDKNLCSWNCMISGFAQNQQGERSLRLFQNMKVPPNEFSIVGVLCACTQLGDLRHGKEVHGYVFRYYLQNNSFILSTLVDMYNKCGRLDIAEQVFESSEEKSIASWNSMISAYGMHGQGRRSIELFSRMCNSGVKATKSTFVALLSACNHCGLVDEGWKYYNIMSKKLWLEPDVEHHVHLIGMLGRAGRLGDAHEFIMKLPVKAEAGVWGALLSACRDHGNLDIGRRVAENLFCSEPENTGYYVTLSNLFAYCGMWNDAVKTRGIILDRGLWKPPGCSAFEARTLYMQYEITSC